MTKILFWSDLHTEFAPFQPPSLSRLDQRPDALVLAGDTATGLTTIAHAEAFSRHFACPVVLVAGNHEFYNGNIETVSREMRARAAERNLGADVRVLDGAGEVETTIGDLRIVGATLWTDYALDGDPVRAKTAAAGLMNDHRCIATGTPARPATPDDLEALHHRDRDAIFAALARPHDGPTLVVTHHAPSPGTMDPQYAGSPLNPAFLSDLDTALNAHAFDAWIYGHTHSGREFSVSHGGRLVTNPRGYPHETTAFDPCRMLALG